MAVAGQIAYESRISGNTENLTVTAQILSHPGKYEYSLMELLLTLAKGLI